MLRRGEIGVRSPVYRVIGRPDPNPSDPHPLLRYLAHVGLFLVHRQLQPLHDRAHRGHGVLRPALAADHEVVRVVDDAGAP